MADEIPPPQVPPNPPVPPPDQTPPNLQAPPPAADLVIKGEVKSERELELDRRAEEIARRESTVKDVETNLSDKERKIQEREEALLNAPPPAPAPEKKPKRYFIRTLINTNPDNE